MNLKIGIVGLPNVGKSTLFNALIRNYKAPAENFPFCTIEPNVGLVEVPDKRVDTICEIVHPAKTVRSSVEFVDIAGLVKGASKGEGLGNQFLSHIRECHAICHVLRDFEDTNIHHVEGTINPKNDLDVIFTELILADLQSIEKQIDRVVRKARSLEKEAQLDLSLLERFKEVLEQGKLAKDLVLTEEEKERVKTFFLLSTKPFLILANVAESAFASFREDDFRQKIGLDASVPIIAVCAKFESDLIGMTEEESAVFLSEIGAKESGLENLIHKSFFLLGLQSYFTAGPKEVHSWTIRKGMTAPQAAGEIHTDFEKGFIRAEIIGYEDFIACMGELGAKEKGKLRSEGKEYVMKDGDVAHFRFNV